LPGILRKVYQVLFPFETGRIISVLLLPISHTHDIIFKRTDYNLELYPVKVKSMCAMIKSDIKKPLPPIDTNASPQIETATIALG